ncbi:MAG: imidazolonepropionase, partial [Steroidobacteraceae bacterium]
METASPSTARTRFWRNASLATFAGDAGLGIVARGAVLTRGERIVYAGPEDQAPSLAASVAEVIDCEGRWITPGLIDCHTHLVHAGHRADEFEQRLRGVTYAEIAAAGGGI